MLKRTPMTRSSGLTRSPIGSSSAPMKRTPMAAGSAGLKRTAFAAGSTRLRSRGPKMTPIRRSARGEDCDLNIPGICNHATSTTVWCHSNLYADGKGMGIKADDEAGCNGCSACHAFYDGGWTSHPGWTRELVNQRFAVARAKSRLKLMQKGLVK